MIQFPELLVDILSVILLSSGELLFSSYYISILRSLVTNLENFMILNWQLTIICDQIFVLGILWYYLR